MAKHIHLRKANDVLVSHCTCAPEEALVTTPAQMDCPWCGCGWLFICGRCRRAFTFAEGVELDESLDDTGRRLLFASEKREPSAEEIEDWARGMRWLLDEVQPGETYVYFDGYAVPASVGSIEIMGLHSHHQLDFLPHTAALDDPEVHTRLLSSRDYWVATAVTEEDKGEE